MGVLRKIIKFAPAVASLLIGVGLQVSGIQIPWLGYSLMLVGVLLLVIPAWPLIRKLRRVMMVVSGAEIYQVGDNSHWLRLKIENSSAELIRGCYGKLLDRTMVRSMLTTINGELVRPAISPESGHESREHMEFPPEGHRFPWSPSDRSLTTISISTNRGSEYLYLVRKGKQTGCFSFPSSAGDEPTNWALGDFQLQLEIGAEVETVKPSRVQVIFRAEGGDLELVSVSSALSLAVPP